jgi:hypothetical protein
LARFRGRFIFSGDMFRRAGDLFRDANFSPQNQKMVFLFRRAARDNPELRFFILVLSMALEICFN